MSESINEKVDKVKKIFKDLSIEERYKALILLGKSMKFLSPELRTNETLVPGCQSILYVHALLIDGKMHFQAYSEALISAGLAQLLLMVYEGEAPETVLTYAPKFITELQISETLTPNRSSGLYHIHLRMRQLALQQLTTPAHQ